VERIIRSCLQVGGVPESEEAIKNWVALQEHSLSFYNESDQKIADYLKRFYSDMSSPPEFALVKEYFEKKDDIEVVDRLEEIKRAQFYIRTNLLAIIRSESEQQLLKKFINTIREAGTIAEHGRNLERPIEGKRILKGTQDALGYLYDKMPDFTKMETGERLEGIPTEEAAEILEEYDKTKKSNKLANRNLFGLEPVDIACAGHRAGEYWIHCAFAGQLKTSLALNYMYNNCFMYGKNIFYACLEMPYVQLRRQFFIIHSAHGKFVSEWHEKDKKTGRPNPYLGLDYRKLRDGDFDDLDYKRLEIVVQDFEANSKGIPKIWRPRDSMPKMDEIRRAAEAFHNKHGCDGIVLDYLGLISPKYRTKEYTTNINSVVTEGRWLALNFARGRTIPVLALFQMNRQGLLRAEKSDGHYDFSAISYANQIEKDADVITYTFLNDQLRSEGKFYLGNLKNRDNAIFERMIGKILWQCKRMRSVESAKLDVNLNSVLNGCDRISAVGTASDMLM
jgi:replicative DNA helicase